MKPRKLIITYLVFLHIALVFIVIKTDFIPRLEQKLGLLPDELTPFYHNLVASHSRIDGSLPDKTTIFIGDSITQGLAVSAVATPSVNYGIGMDTSYGVLQRIGKYKSLKTAKAVVLAIGYNDLKRRNNAEILDNYKRILNIIPKQTKIIISAILPVDERFLGIGYNARIREINSALEKLSQLTPNMVFSDVSEKLQDSSLNLSIEYHEGDGIHLNPKGYEIWIKALQKDIPDE